METLLCLQSSILVKAMFFSSCPVHMWELDNKKGWEPKFMSSNCGAGEDCWESFGLQD